MPNAKCCGKNLYSPGPNAPKRFQKPLESEKNELKSEEKISKNYDTNISKNSSKEEFARKEANFSFSSSSDGSKKSRRAKSNSQKDLFEEFGLEKNFPYKPRWWFRDLKKLKKALTLLRKKLLEGYRVRNFVKFLSHLLSRGVFGYRRHCARNLSLAVVKPTLKRVEPMFSSEPITAGYEAIVALKKKHNLDMSFTNIQKLLRKGFDHLSSASHAVLKRMELGNIKNINAFMHFAVSMKEPYDLLKPKESTE